MTLAINAELVDAIHFVKYASDCTRNLANAKLGCEVGLQIYEGTYVCYLQHTKNNV
jgi:hypothetical protein